MRIPLKALGLTATLLFGTHIEARLDCESTHNGVYSTANTTIVEVVTPPCPTLVPQTGTSKTPALAVSATPVNFSSIQELEANLHEVGISLKEGISATFQALGGVSTVVGATVNLVIGVTNIVIGIAKIGLAFSKFVWSSGKIVHLTGGLIVEGIQIGYAYVTK